MSRISMKALVMSLLPLGLALGAAAGGLPEGPAHDLAQSPSCEIRVAQSGGVEIEALVFTPIPLSGTYEMQVLQAGADRSDIRQSGDFEVAPGTPASVGVVSLCRGSRDYVATLRVTWDGGSTDCMQRVGVGMEL